MAGGVEESGRYRASERRFRPWLLAAALASVPAVFLQGSASDTWATIGDLVGVAVWIVFLTEIFVLLQLTADRGAWLRSHKLELFVAVSSMPLVPMVQDLRAVVSVVPVLELLKLLKVLKLAKVARLLRKAGLSAALLRLALGALAFVGVGLLASIATERKLATPAHGVGFVVDALGDTLGGSDVLAGALLVVVVFGAIELWALRAGKEAAAVSGR